MAIDIDISIDVGIADEIRRLLTEVQEKFNELASKVNSILRAVPQVLEWAVSSVIDAWNSMVEKMAEVWDWFTDKLAYVGSPAALSAASAVWNESVAIPAAALTERLELASLKVDDSWQGDSAEQYRQGISPQQKAAEGLKDDYALNVSAGLGALATALTTFWIAVAATIAALIIEITVGIATIAGVVTAPAVLVVIGVALGTAALGLGTAGTALYMGVDDANSKLDDTSLRTSAWPTLAI